MAEQIALNVDCMEYMKTVPDKYFDLAVVDPPYRDKNAPFQQMRSSSVTNKVFSSGRPTQKFFEEIKRVSNAQIVFGANNFGLEYKGFFAWDKCVRGSNLYSQVEIASLSENLSKVSTLVQISTYISEQKIHPTQKPVALYQWIFKNYAKQGDKILDTHLGSGSSRIAAYEYGLDFVGCEIDKEYFEAQEKRFREYTSQTSIMDIVERNGWEQMDIIGESNGCGGEQDA